MVFVFLGKDDLLLLSRACFVAFASNLKHLLLTAELIWLDNDGNVSVKLWKADPRCFCGKMSQDVCSFLLISPPAAPSVPG